MVLLESVIWLGVDQLVCTICLGQQVITDFLLLNTDFQLLITDFLQLITVSLLLITDFLLLITPFLLLIANHFWSFGQSRAHLTGAKEWRAEPVITSRKGVITGGKSVIGSSKTVISCR